MVAREVARALIIDLDINVTTLVNVVTAWPTATTRVLGVT
jgi:hypothetical protein